MTESVDNVEMAITPGFHPSLFDEVCGFFNVLRCFCLNTGPPALRPIREDGVMGIKCLTQGHNRHDVDSNHGPLDREARTLSTRI